MWPPLAQSLLSFPPKQRARLNREFVKAPSDLLMSRIDGRSEREREEREERAVVLA
jgi:hypothetical protein